MKCKLADKAFYMATKMKILSEEDTTMKEIVRFYAYEQLPSKPKIVLANFITETEKVIKENKNG